MLADLYHKLCFMLLWEKDINIMLELTEWQEIANNLSKMSINTNLVEFNYKTMLRWYLVLTRIERMYPTASQACFRHCGQLGTMYHVWWQCLIISIMDQNL